MWPDRLSNPGPLTYESGALPTALHGPATKGNNSRRDFLFASLDDIILPKWEPLLQESGVVGWRDGPSKLPVPGVLQFG